MTTAKKKQSWADELQEAALPLKTDNPKKPKANFVNPVTSDQEPVINDIRVIVRDARKDNGEVHPMALRLPKSILERLDRHIAGQRHAAIIALIEFGLDELISQKKVLEVK